MQARRLTAPGPPLTVPLPFGTVRTGLVYGHGQVAQLVEQRTENPRVVGSIPTLATKSCWCLTRARQPVAVAHSRQLRTRAGGRGSGAPPRIVETQTAPDSLGKHL